MSQDTSDRNIQRAVMWERIKGEMRAIGSTYMDPDLGYDEWVEFSEDFIKQVEERAIGNFT